MNERLKCIIAAYNLSVSSFASKIGANQVTINQQILGDRKVSLDTVSKIISSFPNISSDWILTGKGEMLKQNDTLGISVVGNNGGVNVGNINGNINKNNISISLPETGTQKIIKSDGSVSIENESRQESADRCERLERRVSDLEKIIEAKDQTIATLQDMVKMLKP